MPNEARSTAPLRNCLLRNNIYFIPLLNQLRKGVVRRASLGTPGDIISGRNDHLHSCARGHSGLENVKPDYTGASKLYLQIFKNDLPARF